MNEVGWDLQAEKELWKDICKRDFYWFAKIAWGIHWFMKANPHQRWFTDEVHKPLCEWAQEKAERWRERRKWGVKKRTKIMVIVPRGFGKTTLFTKAFSLWNHITDSELATYIGSEVESKARQFLAPIKEVMKGTDGYGWFAYLYGVWEDPQRMWAADAIVHGYRRSTARGEPSYKCWGVEGGLTGDHPDMGFFDDPLSEEKITEDGKWIEKVVESVAAIKPALLSDSFFAVICTRYRDHDVAGTYLSPRSEGVATWSGHPCPGDLYPPRDDGQWDVYFLQARDPITNQSILPEVHPTEELDSYERALPREFAAQMMNDPAQGAHAVLTPSQIEDMWVNSTELPLQLVYTMHTDTAFKIKVTGRRGAESVVEIWGHDPRGNGDVYFIEGYSSHIWRAEDFLEQIKDLFLKYEERNKRIRLLTKDTEIGGDKGTSEVAIRSWLIGAKVKRLPEIKSLKRGREKMARIIDVIPYWVDGHVKLVKGAPGVNKLSQQMTRLGITELNDWADAAADVFHPEVYNPMLFKDGGEEGEQILAPGDELLKGFRRPRSNDDYRYIYDYAEKEREDEFSWRP